MLRNALEIVDDGIMEYHPWRSEGVVCLGDFVRVLKGEWLGREGLVTRFLESGMEVEISPTYNNREPRHMLELGDDVMVTGDELEGLDSPAEKIVASPFELYIGDRVRKYDTVRIQHEAYKKLIGVVRAIRPDGFLHVYAPELAGMSNAVSVQNTCATSIF